MTVTLDMLRALLERALTHTDNPAILRLPEAERTVERVAWAYLSRGVALYEKEADMASLLYRIWALEHRPPRPTARLDLTEPGTSHALLVALALALGLDPGPAALGVNWLRDGELAWILTASWNSSTFTAIKVHATFDCWIDAPLVAAESDPVRALALAVAHVLGTP